MAQALIASAPVQSALTARLTSALYDLRARRARRRTFLQTKRELSLLTGRELSDLGLHRSEIRRIAWQAAYEL